MVAETDWRVTDIDSSGSGALMLRADFVRSAPACPKCGTTRRPRRYGSIESNYRDTPFLGRQVVIAVDTQRFRCVDCGQTFFQELADMDAKRRMTARCADYVIDQVMARSSMSEVARIVGLNEKTIRNVFEDRGMIFSVGDPPRNDRFVCECCIGIHPKSELRLAPFKHFGLWRKGELRPDATVCRKCFEFAQDPWRAGIIKRRAYTASH